MEGNNLFGNGIHIKKILNDNNVNFNITFFYLIY